MQVWLIYNVRTDDALFHNEKYANVYIYDFCYHTLYLFDRDTGKVCEKLHSKMQFKDLSKDGNDVVWNKYKYEYRFNIIVMGDEWQNLMDSFEYSRHCEVSNK